MKTLHLLAGAGVASFLLFLISNIPAGLLTARLEASMPGAVKIGATEGTLWNGYVRSIDMTGWQLRDTRWRIQAPALLIGRLAADIETRTAGGELSGHVSLSLFGNLSVSELEAAGPVAPLAKKFNLPLTGGRYQAAIETLDLVDDWPTAMIGTATLTGIPLNLFGGPATVTGNYLLSFDHADIPDSGEFAGAMVDEGGPIEVTGSLRLTPPNAFDLQAKLKTRAGAPQDFVQAMNLLGPEDPEGRRDFTLSGTL